MTDNTTVVNHAPVLAAGLRWLYKTKQPDGALLQHHGVMLEGEGNRSFGFVPAGADGQPVVVLYVAEIEWRTDSEGDEVPANPLEPDELAHLAATLTGLGAEVTRTWNGHPACTGSVGLAKPAHPSLLAAGQLYKKGCPEHPKQGVFCGCGWWSQGSAKVVHPAEVVA